MKKEFGKFTEQQIREFIVVMPIIFEARSEYLAELRDNPSKLPKVIPKPVNWSWGYELPIEEHVARAAEAIGLAEAIIAMSTLADPQQAALDDIKTVLPVNHQPNADIQTIWELTEGLASSYECLVIYGKYINQIIAEVRDNVDGAEEWLFKAIRIDPTVIACCTAQDRLCRAILLNNQNFMNELQKALKGKTGAQAKYLNDFRVLMQLLHESGAENLTNNQISELVFKLGIYKNTGDAKHNVSELIRKYRKS